MHAPSIDRYIHNNFQSAILLCKFAEACAHGAYRELKLASARILNTTCKKHGGWTLYKISINIYNNQAHNLKFPHTTLDRVSQQCG